MEFKGTPWTMEYDNSDDRSGGQWYCVGPVRISFPYGLSDDELKEVNDAARVMTVAPELLGALQMLLATAGEINDAPDSLLEMALESDDQETRNQANAHLCARAVIRKATE